MINMEEVLYQEIWVMSIGITIKWSHKIYMFRIYKGCVKHKEEDITLEIPPSTKIVS